MTIYRRLQVPIALLEGLIAASPDILSYSILAAIPTIQGWNLEMVAHRTVGSLILLAGAWERCLQRASMPSHSLIFGA